MELIWIIVLVLVVFAIIGGVALAKVLWLLLLVALVVLLVGWLGRARP